jgi:hypothetical protein
VERESVNKFGGALHSETVGHTLLVVQKMNMEIPL